MQVTEKQIKDWKTQYGKVFLLTADEEDVCDQDIYIRKPTRPMFDRFQSTLMKKDKTGEATKQLLFDVLLFPEKEVLQQLFDERPGLVTAIGNKLMEIVGTTVNFTVKAL